MNIEDIKNELYKEIYSKQSTEEIDENIFQKKLFELFKICIKEKNYITEIGAYTINFHPKELFVSYETLSTYLEISNKDIYEENEIVEPISYYAIKKNEDNYNEKSEILKIANTILKVDDYYKENFYIEMCNSQTGINEYIKQNKDTNIFSNSAEISKYININDPRIEIENYLNLEKLVKVEYNQQTKTYSICESKKNKKTYHELLPDLSYNKKIIKLIYENIVNFYSQYI